MDANLRQLSKRLDGELHFGLLMRSLYATDASVYRELPLAVALPKHENDVQMIMAFANDNQVPLIPRAAGTSLAGQCVGSGMVVDMSKYMNQVLEINEAASWVRVQPGVIRDELNTILEPLGLFFGPNTSTSNRCNIGGMVGNNSCGTTSIVYGSTRDHVLELRTVLSNGDIANFKGKSREDIDGILEKNASFESDLYSGMTGILSNKEIEAMIRENYPSEAVTRRNTGYALDSLINMKPFDKNGTDLNLCSLLCGSEGTLALTTEIKLNLVPSPDPNDVVLAAHFSSVEEALKATVVAMGHNPTACELMDKTILDCTKDNISQRKNRFFIEGDPAAILMIEFRSKQLEDALDKVEKLIQNLKKQALGFAYPIISGDQTPRVWALRNAGLGVLANIPGDKKAVACIEDTAVAVNDLPNYIREFSHMMANFKQKAVYYAHAGAGELHLRPVLNLKDSADVKRFREISEASAKLIKKYKGSLSGEHGDGRVRAEFIPLVLGQEIYDILKKVKTIWDPKGLLNPGKIVDALPMDTSLRYVADRTEPLIKTQFNFEETGGMLRTVEKCNGSGDCRKLNFAGGTMCPSYRATLDEKDTTRGRANILREFLTQNDRENPFDHPEIKTAMDLCISCKGCKSECPSNIDMATLKSEFLYQYHKSNPRSLSSRLVANVSRLNRLGQRIPGITNRITASSLFKRLMNVHPQRSMPKLSQHSLKQWFKHYEQPRLERAVYLFCDEYTNHYDIHIGKMAVQLLNRLGYEVKMIDHPESGRAFLSKGFLEEAKQIAIQHLKLFADLVDDRIPLIGIEPSAILSFKDEYPNLVELEDKKKALKLSQNVFLIEEFLLKEIDAGHFKKSAFTDEKRKILVHGHCHQKALGDIQDTVKILSFPKNYSVDLIPSGCCGMAGAFGYEKEHYELSQSIGEQILLPAIREAESTTLIAANGTSCRHQIKDATSRHAIHPLEILFDALL